MGASCCGAGLECVVRDEWYSQCVRTEPRLAPGLPGPSGTCSSAWEQCGGLHWTGATCCSDGQNCTAHNMYYSQCVPRATASVPTPAPTAVPAKPEPSGRCPAAWEQCGGAAWSGATCCAGGHECTVRNPWYSQCTPIPLAANGTCAGEWEQCGGMSWTGAACCVAGLRCEARHAWYSQCLREREADRPDERAPEAKTRARHLLRRPLGADSVLLQSAHAVVRGGGSVVATQREAGSHAERASRRADVLPRATEL